MSDDTHWQLALERAPAAAMDSIRDEYASLGEIRDVAKVCEDLDRVRAAHKQASARLRESQKSKDPQIAADLRALVLHAEAVATGLHAIAYGAENVAERNEALGQLKARLATGLKFGTVPDVADGNEGTTMPPPETDLRQDDGPRTEWQAYVEEYERILNRQRQKRRDLLTQMLQNKKPLSREVVATEREEVATEREEIKEYFDKLRKDDALGAELNLRWQRWMQGDRTKRNEDFRFLYFFSRLLEPSRQEQIKTVLHRFLH